MHNFIPAHSQVFISTNTFDFHNVCINVAEIVGCQSVDCMEHNEISIQSVDCMEYNEISIPTIYVNLLSKHQVC